MHFHLFEMENARVFTAIATLLILSVFFAVQDAQMSAVGANV
jgi:hypothetical protein